LTVSLRKSKLIFRKVKISLYETLLKYCDCPFKHLETKLFSGNWSCGCCKKSHPGGFGGNHAGCCHHPPGALLKSFVLKFKYVQ
jgi:hypothetical protein